MSGLAQLRGVLHLARKHAWILAGLAAIPLGVAAWQARSREPVYRAAAMLQIRPRPATWFGSNDVWVDEDRMFIPDQVFRIPKDREIATRALDRVRAWAGGAPLPEALRGTSPELLAAGAAGFDADDLPAAIALQPVPDTSYYRLEATGRSREFVAALAHAFSQEVVARLRDEGARAVDSQFDRWEREAQQRRDTVRERSDALGQELARLQEENPGVDFTRRVNLPQQALDAVRQGLADARERFASLAERRREAEAALRTVGLEFASMAVGEGRAWRLDPPLRADASEDPRLSPFVLALPAVAGDAGVRAARERVAALREADLALGSGTAALQEGKGERAVLRQRILRAEADEARAAEAALAGLAAAADAAASQVTRLEGRERSLDAESARQAVALAKADSLHRRLEDQRREVDALDGRLAEAARTRKTTLDAGAGARNSVAVVQEATLRGVSVVAPDLPRIWSWALLASLALAGGALWLLQQFDDTVKSREDYDRLVRGLAFLGVVPAIAAEEGEGDRIAAIEGRTGTPVVESIRALRTTLHHAGAAGRELRTILLTSSGPREGKTTLSANLAVSFAQGGLRTLLVDGDLRRPRVHRMAGTSNERGLSTVLAGKATLAEAIVPCGLVAGLDVLPSGPIPHDPAELLSGPAMRELLAGASRLYDRVIIDSPPIVTVTDPCILAPLVDAVLLVIAHGATSARLIRRAREAMDSVGARVSGAVVNNAAPRRGFYGDPYYGYDYRYGYSAEPARRN